MRNEPSEPMRVVTRCALLCLGSRAEGPSHSLRRPAALGLSFPSDAARETRTRGNERAREHLENDQPSGQRALGAASRYYLKEVLCIYRYIQPRVSHKHTSKDNIYCLTAAVSHRALTNDFCKLYSRMDLSRTGNIPNQSNFSFPKYFFFF